MKFYDMMKAAALVGGGSSPSPSPFPEDCPFTCDTKYFVSSQVSFAILSTTYQKTTKDYAIGMIAQINANGAPYTTGLFLSPIEDAVKFTNNTSAGGTITYKGETWYYSGAMYAQDGYHTGSGMENYPDVIEFPYTEEGLTAVLEAVNAKNKRIS